MIGQGKERALTHKPTNPQENIMSETTHNPTSNPAINTRQFAIEAIILLSIGSFYVLPLIASLVFHNFMLSLLGVACGLTAFGASFAVYPDWHFQWYWRKEYRFLSSKFYQSFSNTLSAQVWTQKTPSWQRRILGCCMFSAGVFIVYTLGSSTAF
jgi:uncharacterized membrane protein HdeD (DUF308 family)